MDDEEKRRNYELAEKLISEQNFSAAVIAGGVATLLAAAVHGLIVARWPVSYGFAATGIGIVIGLSIGIAGRGIAARFAVLAAAYTIIGCVVGNLFRAAIELAPASATSPIDVLQNTSVPALIERSSYYIFSIALIYWFVAVVAAVFLARRALSRTQRLALGLRELRA